MDNLRPDVEPLRLKVSTQDIEGEQNGLWGWAMETFAGRIVEDEDLSLAARAFYGGTPGCISATAKRNNFPQRQEGLLWREAGIVASWCACAAFSVGFWGSLVWLII